MSYLAYCHLFLAGLDYVDEQLSLGGQRVKPYTIYNMAWQTTVDNWQWQLSAKTCLIKNTQAVVY